MNGGLICVVANGNWQLTRLVNQQPQLAYASKNQSWRLAASVKTWTTAKKRLAGRNLRAVICPPLSKADISPASFQGRPTLGKELLSAL